MAVKKCCIYSCNSCSTRKEDIGVTYHKFPRDKRLHDLWVKVTLHESNTDVVDYVCSRHFCKSDFQMYKDSKYILKSEAVPSIFSWTIVKATSITPKKMEKKKDKVSKEVVKDNISDVLNSSKESDGENLDAIKKFIENQEKEISEAKLEEDAKNIIDNKNISIAKIDEPNIDIETVEEPEEFLVKETQNETLAVASSVIDMILSESEAKLAEKSDKKLVKQTLSTSDKVGNGTMALSVGSKVEAKDFAEFWHPAEITEVDYDEMEVLVHYEDVTKKHDEWISVSSPRLRPISSTKELLSPNSEPSTSATDCTTTAPLTLPLQIKEEQKIEEKQKVAFTVGERCLARWRDNRRFIATVTADLGDGKYEIVFDDGVKWTCNYIRLSKLKESAGKDPLTIDTSGQPATCATPSPVYGSGPSIDGVSPQTTPSHGYNTHLFDPTRDYLGSKSERREMKRKLNIKEIFNIGQKKKKVETPKKPTPVKEKTPTPKVAKEKKPQVKKKKVKTESSAAETKPAEKVTKDIPDAIASIIGTVSKEIKEEPNKVEVDVKSERADVNTEEGGNLEVLDLAANETSTTPDTQQMKQEEEKVSEEVKLEIFEKHDEVKHEEVIDRIKEAITKLEDGLNEPELKLEKLEDKTADKTETKIKKIEIKPVVSEPPKEEKKKSLSKVKKVKKVRLLQEKKVKKQVEKVKCELEEMKKQVEEMRKQMSEELLKKNKSPEVPDSFLMPGEWCCKWVNGQPVGAVSEIVNEGKLDVNNKPALPRRSVQVEDKRLPPGWTKHMVRRSFGNSAGKWDVVLMTPDNRRIHTKTDMKHYLESNQDESLKPFEAALMDFGIHMKLSRRMGWYTTTPDGEQQLPVGTLSTTSPLLTKRKKLSLNKPKKLKEGKKPKLRMKFKMPKEYEIENYSPSVDSEARASTSVPLRELHAVADETPENRPLEDGFVYVGSLKVQIIENLLRCPADGCFKNFRNNTLLKMHIKHYHRELRKMLGATPKVLDLAYARQRPTQTEMRRLKFEAQHKTIKVKIPKLPRRAAEHKIEKDIMNAKVELTPIKIEGEKIPRSQDSPKLRYALGNKPVKRPKVLLPVRRPEQIENTDLKVEVDTEDDIFEPKSDIPVEPLDFETAISTHTVTKAAGERRKGDKKKKIFALMPKRPLTASEDEDWLAVNSDVETRSSYPRSGTPDSKIDLKLTSESNEDQKEANYMFTETGERIKIVHMKREEIINCHCGFREEDGLMVQCELCLCWQHALCHNIQKESEVPEKYTCSICLNPRRGRRSQRFLHDQDRLYEGLLPGAKPCESLRRSHELSGNLHRIEDALQALRVKYYVATKKDHPKLYLWAKDWETGELTKTQEKLNSDYSDLNIIINNIGKENLPVKAEDMKDMPLDIRTPPSEEQDGERFTPKDIQLGSQALLSGLLSSPGSASIDLPISTTELERLAKTVQEQEAQRVIIPQPEAAIENSACRERLLKHIQRCQAVIDARLDSIEAQVAELESQDPSFEDDETADYFPRTKQTIQMLMRDLDTMEELGVIT